MKPVYQISGKRVFVAGEHGMVGSALVRRLQSIDCEIIHVGRGALDLRRQKETEDFFARTRPQLVFLAAAKVGGIVANRDHPAEFLYDNLMIEANVIEAARKVGVEKLVFLGSSCSYPKHASQPIGENALLTGPLEPTNEPYAIAKIAGIKLAEAYRKQHGCDFISVQPTNLFGPGDNFDPETSHVPAALLRRFHEAKLAGASKATVWGTGTPRRDFLYIDDLADACVFLTEAYSGKGPVNIGSGKEIAIADFARMVAEVVGYRGAITFDTSRPDGTPRKLLDIGLISGMGWKPKVHLRAGLERYYESFLATAATGERPIQVAAGIR